MPELKNSVRRYTQAEVDKLSDEEEAVYKFFQKIGKLGKDHGDNRAVFDDNGHQTSSWGCRRNALAVAMGQPPPFKSPTGAPVWIEWGQPWETGKGD